MKYISFETERCILKPITLEDANFIIELFNTPKWLEYIGDRNVHNVEAAENYIKEKMFPQLESHGYGNFLVVNKMSNEKMGTCGIYDRPTLEGTDIGFAFLPTFEKQGYAFEAAEKLLEAAFNIFNLEKVGAITIPRNEDSRRLLERLGLSFVKIFKMEGDNEELMYYEIIKPENSDIDI